MAITAPFPTYTPTWHKDTYAAIDPTRPELSVRGKSVVITGAGTGIGAATVKAYAQAGAARIAILARREHLLNQVKQSIENTYPGTKITVHGADVTDLDSLKYAASEIGAWDVLVLNAGYLSEHTPLVEADPVEWWRGYEINVKGTFNSLQAFIPGRNEHAKVIGISSAVAALPPQAMINLSSYVSTKIAMSKILEIFAAEIPDLFVINVHPGVVRDGSEMAQKSKLKNLPEDTANFILWAASEEASFLRGKFAYCNWDVNELRAKSKELQESAILTTGILGWPWLGGGN